MYKFVYGVTAAQRTVLRSATDLMLDAMRELDEAARDDATNETLGVLDEAHASSDAEGGAASLQGEPEREHARISPENSEREQS